MEESEVNICDTLNMLKHFPLLLPNNDFKCWDGIVNIKGTDVVFSITVPNYPDIKDLRIKCSDGFQSAVNNILKQVEQNHYSCLTNILLDLQKSNVLPTVTHTSLNLLYNYKITNSSWFSRYNTIFKELQSIGIENVVKTDATLTNISLKEVDYNGHEHVLEIKLPSNYPYSKPVLEYADLPDTVLPQLTMCSNIGELYLKFCSLISTLQNFWNVYYSLLENTWVIDPEYPKKRDTYCRIVIGDNVSILVLLNPSDVSTFPEIKFLGADKAIQPLRKTLEDNIKLFGWDMNQSLVDNLLNILGLDEFPQRPMPTNSQQKPIASNENDLLVNDQECSICFMLRAQDNMLPTKICNNDKCTSVFHLSCLAQWFQSVPTNEPTFNVISGDCPHCGKRILCPINVLQ